MLTRRQFTVMAGSAAAATAAPLKAAAPSSSGGRRAEVSALRVFAEKTHPRGRETSSDAGWRARWDRLEASAETLPDGAYFIGVRRGLGWFGDGHTTPLPFEFTGGVPDPLKDGPFGLSLPIRISLFHDGAFVTAAGAGHQALLGTKIGQIGSMKSDELVRAIAQDWPGNQAWAHRWAGSSLASPAHLQGLGALTDPRRPVRLAVAGTDAQQVEIAPLGRSPELIDATRPTTAVERWAGEARAGNYVRPLRDRNAIYISIDDMEDAEGKTFVDLTRDAFEALSLDWPERVVVDLRRNGGGNNFLGEPLRKHLAAGRFNRSGGLYVLIGPKTFSAAQNLATRLERETFATFIGEPTGGAPNHYGDAKIFTGEATGIASIVSALPWFDSYPQDDRPWIMPDILVTGTFADWIAGRDTALETAMTHRAPPIDELSRERIFFYERPSQKQDWTPFWLTGSGAAAARLTSTRS